VEWFDAGGVMDVTRHCRQIADLAWPMASPSTIGGTAVPGYPDQADIDFIGVGWCDIGQAHESSDARETWQVVAGNGSVGFGFVSHEIFEAMRISGSINSKLAKQSIFIKIQASFLSGGRQSGWQVNAWVTQG
jgi:hypothetical protein